jgi:hypothetical protein
MGARGIVRNDERSKVKPLPPQRGKGGMGEKLGWVMPSLRKQTSARGAWHRPRLRYGWHC